VDRQCGDTEHTTLKKRVNGREFNTSLFIMRAVQNGFTVADLEKINLGIVFDCFVELEYDDKGYIRDATQADYDAF